MSAPFEEVLDLYGLQEGDKAVVRLALQAVDVEATVTDDRLLYVVTASLWTPSAVSARPDREGCCRWPL